MGRLAEGFCRYPPWTFSQPCSRPKSRPDASGLGRNMSLSQSMLCPRQATLPDPSHPHRNTNTLELAASRGTVTLCFAFSSVSTHGSGEASVFQILMINFMASSIGCCMLAPTLQSKSTNFQQHAFGTRCHVVARLAGHWVLRFLCFSIVGRLMDMVSQELAHLQPIKTTRN